MKHKFTCHTTKNSIILQFSMKDLKRMELEYKEVYEELFDEQDSLLELTLEEKQKAILVLEERFDGNLNQSIARKPERKASRTGKDRRKSHRRGSQ